MTWHVIPDYGSYERARREFEWSLPDRYNPARDCLGKHDAPEPADRTALIDAATGQRLSYRDIDERSGRLANGLAARGIEPGDRVGVLAPQRPATPVAHMACWKPGAVTVPLTTLFGDEALAYRLDDAGGRAVVFDPPVGDSPGPATVDRPDLETAVALGDHPWYVGAPDATAVDPGAFECAVVDHRALVVEPRDVDRREPGAVDDDHLARHRLAVRPEVVRALDDEHVRALGLDTDVAPDLGVERLEPVLGQQDRHGVVGATRKADRPAEVVAGARPHRAGVAEPAVGYRHDVAGQALDGLAVVGVGRPADGGGDPLADARLDAGGDGRPVTDDRDARVEGFPVDRRARGRPVEQCP